MIKNKRGNWLLCAFVSSLSTIRICRRLAVSKPFLTLLPDLPCWSIGRTKLIKPWLELEWDEWGIASGSKFRVVMKNLVIKIILMQYLLKSKLSQNPWWKNINIFNKDRIQIFTCLSWPHSLSSTHLNSCPG